MTAIKLIGVPLDVGANIRGASLGPNALRSAQLHTAIEKLGYAVEDHGNLPLPLEASLSPEQKNHNYLAVVAEACLQLAHITYQSKKQNKIPITLGGDHSIAIGSISGVSHALQEQGAGLGVIWFDAHADINTPESSLTGNIHGMPVAVLLGHGYPVLTHILSAHPKISPRNLVLIGLRALDPQEKNLCREWGVTCYTARDLEIRGIQAIMEEAIAIASRGTAGIHVSFDLDGLDPLEAPGVSTPVPGGIRAREAHVALEMIASTKKLSSLDIVELNPCQDRKQQTAQLAVALIQTALGHRIL